MRIQSAMTEGRKKRQEKENRCRQKEKEKRIYAFPTRAASKERRYPDDDRRVLLDRKGERRHEELEEERLETSKEVGED